MEARTSLKDSALNGLFFKFFSFSATLRYNLSPPALAGFLDRYEEVQRSTFDLEETSQSCCPIKEDWILRATLLKGVIKGGRGDEGWMPSCNCSSVC